MGSEGLVWADVPVCAHGEDVVGCDRGADRVLVSPGAREIGHLGSAHSDAEVELLKAAARQKLRAGQGELDLGLRPAASGSGPLPIMSSRMAHLLDALRHAYRVLGLEKAAGGDEVFRDLVLARIIEPVSKLDSLRVLAEAGAAPSGLRFDFDPSTKESPGLRCAGELEYEMLLPPRDTAACHMDPRTSATITPGHNAPAARPRPFKNAVLSEKAQTTGPPPLGLKITIESTFATVRLRTKITKGHGSKAAALALALALALIDPLSAAGGWSTPRTWSPSSAPVPSSSAASSSSGPATSPRPKAATPRQPPAGHHPGRLKDLDPQVLTTTRSGCLHRVLRTTGCAATCGAGKTLNHHSSHRGAGRRSFRRAPMGRLPSRRLRLCGSAGGPPHLADQDHWDRPGVRRAAGDRGPARWRPRIR